MQTQYFTRVFPAKGQTEALTVLVQRQQVWPDGRQSLRYALRKGTQYRQGTRIVAAGFRPEGLSRRVAERLFTEAEPMSKSAFTTIQDVMARETHNDALQAVIDAFRDEGNLAAMLGAARDVYETDPAKLAQVTAFATTFEQATAMQQRRFNALMLYIVVNLLRSQQRQQAG